NFFHRKEAAGGDLTVEEVQRYLQQHAIPSTADAFHALRPGTTFALPFDATMLTPGELQRAQKVHSAEFGTLMLSHVSTLGKTAYHWVVMASGAC
ncbi:hypothetical protein BE221DRAFT_64992, partial [Ostreococcus tauri]